MENYFKHAEKHDDKASGTDNVFNEQEGQDDEEEDITSIIESTNSVSVSTMID